MFDRTKPVNTVPVDADFLRAQLNDLDDRVKAIVPVQGPKGDKGDTGEQGPAMSFPIAGPGIIQGRIISDNGDLTIASSDPNGSGETSVRLVHNGGRIMIVTRVNGIDISSITLDLAGFDDGGGAPSVQDGDLLRYDGSSQTFKCARGITQIVPLGTGQSLQIVSGVVVGVV